MNHRILGPHKEQEGWRYIRVPSSFTTPFPEDRERPEPRLRVTGLGFLNAEVYGDKSNPKRGVIEVAYRDEVPGTRIISSRRVEEAVETADYLKRCADEGLPAGMVLEYGPLLEADGDPGHLRRDVAGWCWRVSSSASHATGPTLREAYHRHKASS